MDPAVTPSLIEALEACAGDDERITCEDAFGIARDFGVKPVAVGRACRELGIKVVQCQLGFF